MVDTPVKKSILHFIRAIISYLVFKPVVFLLKIVIGFLRIHLYSLPEM